MPSIILSPSVTNCYIDLQQKDKAYCKKLNELLKDITRHPTTGLGCPEQLKGAGGNIYSRRINQKDRLVYRIEETGCVTLLQITGHYFR